MHRASLLVVVVALLAVAVAVTNARVCYSSIATVSGDDAQPCDGGICAVDWELGVDPATQQVDYMWSIIGPHRRPIDALHTSAPVVSAVCDDQGATVALTVEARYSDGATIFRWLYDGASVSCADLWDGSVPDAKLRSFRLDISIVGTGTWSTGVLSGAGYGLGALAVDCGNLPVQQLGSASSSTDSATSSTAASSTAVAVSAIASSSTTVAASSTTVAASSTTVATVTTAKTSSTAASSTQGYTSSTSGVVFPSEPPQSSSSSDYSSTGYSTTGYSGGYSATSAGATSGLGNSMSGVASSTSGAVPPPADVCAIDCKHGPGYWGNLDRDEWDLVPGDAQLCGIPYRDIMARGNKAMRHLMPLVARIIEMRIAVELTLLSGSDCDGSDLPDDLFIPYVAVPVRFANATLCEPQTGPSAAATTLLEQWKDKLEAWLADGECVDDDSTVDANHHYGYRYAVDLDVHCQWRFKGNGTKRCLNIFNDTGLCASLLGNNTDGTCLTIFGYRNRNSIAVDPVEQRLVWDKDDSPMPRLLAPAPVSFLPGKTDEAVAVAWECARRKARHAKWCVTTHTKESGNVERCADAEFRVDNCGSKTRL